MEVEEGLAKNANELLQETLSQLQNNQKSLAEWLVAGELHQITQEGKGIIASR